jgi:hypothetical protein
VHEVGTVVFTASAQFGVPAIHMWGLTRDITNCLQRGGPGFGDFQVNVLPFAQTELQLTDNGAPPPAARARSTRFTTLTRMADNVMIYKYVVKCVASETRHDRDLHGHGVRG